MTLAGATVQMEEDFTEILDEGIARLRKLGFDPVAELVRASRPKKSENSPSRSGRISSSWAIAARVHLTVGGQAQRAPI